MDQRQLDKLAKYLSDYINHEAENHKGRTEVWDALYSVLSDGLEAFESAQECEILLSDAGLCPACKAEPIDRELAGDQENPQYDTEIHTTVCSCGETIKETYRLVKQEVI